MTTVNPSTSTETDPVSKATEETVINGDKKEAETPSTETIQQQIENTESAVNQNEADLLKQGQALLDAENYEEAVPLLSNALELIQQKDIATSIESVQYYMSYGEALLKLVQSCNDLFAAPVRESQQAHIAEQELAEQEEEEMEAPQLITDATNTDTEPTETEKTDNDKTEKVENPKEEQDEEEDDDLPQNEEEQEQEPMPVQQGDVDTTEDREIAWETFEYARSIMEEYLNKKENEKDIKYLKLLALCHSFLGELLIEDENNEMALAEYEKALEIQKQCEGEIKVRHRAYNHFMACLAAQFAERYEDALNHCDIALKGLSERICVIIKDMGSTEEMKEDDKYEQVIQIGEEYMKTLDDERKDSEQGKELKELVDVMNDLLAKLDEVKQIIEYKQGKRETENEAEDGNVMNLINMDDPLQALINGLTSKFGIDEQELAAIEEENNKNIANVSNTEQDMNGVTTIGFGNNNQNDNDDEDVNDLSCTVKRKEKKAGKKRGFDQVQMDKEEDGNMKKMKLNSGDAAAVENKVEEDK